MTLFRKRPVEVEAFQWTGGPDQPDDPLWIVEAIRSGEVFFRRRFLVIKTREGNMVASIGDWIIRGTKGELYPCKPDIFPDIYEPVE